MKILHIIVCSTRPGRIGLSIANWFHSAAQEHGGFVTQVVDLAQFNLPIFDEPEHPRLKRYKHQHTKAWSECVDSADAFVFVTPEYNYGPPPAFVNATTYLSKEWAYKAAGFVSYGGISGGLRAVQIEKQTLSTLKVVPLLEAVVVPNAGLQITKTNEEQIFAANEIQSSAATVMLDELVRWADALQQLRSK
jgi:NAD(P)H-dependent FMN reductase